MADQKSTVTLSGDSSELVDAANSATKSVESLTEGVTSLNEVTEAAPKSVESATRAYTEFSSKAKVLGRDVRNSTRAFGDLSGVVSQVSPSAGAALSGVVALSRGIRGATAALGPMTIALGAIALAMKVGQVLWDRHQEALEQAKRAGEEYAATLEDMRSRIAEQAETLNVSNSAAIRYVSTLKGASDVVREFNEEQGRIRASAEISEARDQLKEYNRQARGAGESIADLAAAQAVLRDESSAFSAKMRVLNGEHADIIQQGIKGGKTALEVLQDLQDVRVEEITKLGQQRAGLKQTIDLYDRASEAHEEASKSTEKQAEVTKRATKSAAELSAEMREMADAALKAALASGDFERVGAVLGQGGEAAEYLAQSLADVSYGALAGAGATADMIDDVRALNAEMRTGADVARELQSVYAEGVAEQEAQEQEEADLEARIAAQQEWADVVSLSFDAAQDRQQALLESGIEGIAAMREITDAEMSAITEHFDDIRSQQQQAAQEVQSLQDQMTSGFEAAVSGSLSSAIGSLSSAFTEAMISGENMSEGLGKAALQAIGSIAMQFGTLMLTTAIGLAFMPGFEGNAVGLGVGGGALIALGAALGVAANAIGAGGGGAKGSESETSSKSFGDEYTFERGDSTVISGMGGAETIDPAYDARRQGDARRNADRYGIDKRRAYA